MPNVIRSRSKGEGEFTASSRQVCYRCMDHGDRFVFIRGSRKFACHKHFIEWLEAAQRMGDKLLSSEEA